MKRALRRASADEHVANRALTRWPSLIVDVFCPKQRGEKLAHPAHEPEAPFPTQEIRWPHPEQNTPRLAHVPAEQHDVEFAIAVVYKVAGVAVQVA